MPHNKPVIKDVVPTKLPVVGDSVQPQKKWSFSFRYFNQDRYFGLGNVDPKWFLSLIERLKDLSKHNIDSFLGDFSVRDAYRFHVINWNAKNIPIKRSDINWVDNAIIDNEEDYPFFQFQISKALGRVVGFWDEDYNHFYIVFLDHKHNMQPSKYNNYKVDDTTILYCEHTSLIMDIDKVKGIPCNSEGCKCKEQLSLIPTKINKGKFVYFKVDDDYYEEFIKQTERKSLKEIIELGLISDPD